MRATAELEKRSFAANCAAIRDLAGFRWVEGQVMPVPWMQLFSGVRSSGWLLDSDGSWPLERRSAAT